MGLRIWEGWPRSGIGYLGLPIAALACLAGYHVREIAVVVVTALVVPLEIWLGQGLREDDQDDDCADQVIWKSGSRYDRILDRDHVVTIFRLSTWTQILAVLAPSFALRRTFAVRLGNDLP